MVGATTPTQETYRAARHAYGEARRGTDAAAKQAAHAAYILALDALEDEWKNPK